MIFELLIVLVSLSILVLIYISLQFGHILHHKSILKQNSKLLKLTLRHIADLSFFSNQQGILDQRAEFLKSKHLQKKLNIISSIYNNLDKNIHESLPVNYLNALEQVHTINQSIVTLKRFNKKLIHRIILRLSFKQIFHIQEFTFHNA